MKQLLGLFLIFGGLGWQACSPSHAIGRFAQKDLFEQPGIGSAQVGISLYDPVKAAYLYNWQGDKYFIPASNTKLFTLYAGLKYLGDSLVGVRYIMTDTALFIVPSGDPTLLHPDFVQQPVIDLLKSTKKNIYLTDANWQDKALGRGWAWDDYNDDYMSERSPLPVYGNLIRWVQDSTSASFYSIPDINWDVRFTTDTIKKAFFVRRDLNRNVFTITEGKAKNEERRVPFITDGVASAAILLKDTVGRTIFTATGSEFARISGVVPKGLTGASQASFNEQARSSSASGAVAVKSSSASGAVKAHNPGTRNPGLQVIHSRPVDSLFRPMMYHSDNFFAEQTLLMVSNERFGVMNDARIIDTLLKNDLKELPQKPLWVDGCGLSRNDLFTPRDFVWLLDKMKNEFGLPRMKGILPTGGAGTLASYYKRDSAYIYAKTGSLSGVVALSGYLITKKDHLLIFSVLVNNHTAGSTAIRKDIEKLIEMIREKY